jgi:glycerol kinase
MRNPFELDGSVDGDSEPPNEFEVDDSNQFEVDIRPHQTDDGDRSLLQDEDRRSDDLKERFIGTIDQGTTSTRFIIFDCTGVPIAKYQTEFRQIHEHPGYVFSCSRSPLYFCLSPPSPAEIN